jgi:hypothetical protein
VKRFDSIRPYTDSEVQTVLQQLSKNSDVVRAFISATKFSFLTKIPFGNWLVSKILQAKINNIHTIKEYQSIFENLVSNMIDSKTSGFACNGFENIKPNKSYLYISNHRDITVDPALLNFMLHQNNFKTTNIAVGNNLMSEAWASDLMRLNKSFIIDRTGKSKREIYQGLNLASEYIGDSILEKNEPIWIAQKQGRAKDGIDKTDPALLKMIHLINRKSIPISDYFNSLCFIPVAVSYEFDPNDLFKANELYAIKIQQKYIKTDKEDLNSIANGISGQKGLVNLNIGSHIKFIDNSYEACAQLISRSILDLYQLQPSNFAACEIQNIKHTLECNFSEEQIDFAKEYLETRTKGLEPGIKALLLEQYSNPVMQKEAL